MNLNIVVGEASGGSGTGEFLRGAGKGRVASEKLKHCMVVDRLVIGGFLRLVEQFQLRCETGRGALVADNKKRGEQKQNKKEEKPEQEQVAEQELLHELAELLHAQKLFAFVFFFKIDLRVVLVHIHSFS